jgi:predicted  nucleic acid-binding Zn-ribbon protein
MRFRNYYRCAQCGCEWTDVWSAQCDDDCPWCGARHMSPYKSEDAEDSQDVEESESIEESDDD